MRAERWNRALFVLQVRVPLFAVVYQSVYKNTCISVPRIHFLLYTRWYVHKKRSTQNCTRSAHLYIFWWCTENIGTFLYIFSTPDVILVHVPVFSVHAICTLICTAIRTEMSHVPKICTRNFVNVQRILSCTKKKRARFGKRFIY